MKANVTTILQGKLGKYTYIYRLSCFTKELQSDVTLGIIVVNIKTEKAIAELHAERFPAFLKDEHIDTIKSTCLKEALEIHRIIS